MVRGEAIFFDVKTEADLLKYKGKLKGGGTMRWRRGDGEWRGVERRAFATTPSADTDPDKRPRPWDLNRPAIVPQVVVAAEQYNRIVRLVARGIPVQLEINIAVRFY